MTEKDKYSETERLEAYQHSDGGSTLGFLFNKETKTVDINLFTFIRNSIPYPKSPSEWDLYSSKYGQWQREITCLGMEDVQFIHNKMIELFGEERQKMTQPVEPEYYGNEKPTVGTDKISISRWNDNLEKKSGVDIQIEDSNGKIVYEGSMRLGAFAECITGRANCNIETKIK